MLSVVACAICGLDPASDTMLINLAVAGAISVPWIVRDRIAAVIRRVNGKPGAAEGSCDPPTDEDDAP
jgi:hypothetical protein